MKRILIALPVLICLNACTVQANHTSETQNADSIVSQTNPDMKNLISIVEIPVADFSRASTFYKAILDITIEEVEMEGIKMGLFPSAAGGIAIQLIHGSGYAPSADGTIIYLNGGDNLQVVADKIEASGGKIIIPKTEIGPAMGFYALFTDTEGNKLGLHSYN